MKQTTRIKKLLLITSTVTLFRSSQAVLMVNDKEKGHFHQGTPDFLHCWKQIKHVPS